MSSSEDIKSMIVVNEIMFVNDDTHFIVVTNDEERKNSKISLVDIKPNLDDEWDVID